MPVLVYSLLRILLIVAAGGGLYLAGMRGVLLVVVAVLVGAGLSYVLLDRFRRASAQWLASRGRGKTRWENRLTSDADDEDALLDTDGPTDGTDGTDGTAGSDSNADAEDRGRIARPSGAEHRNAEERGRSDQQRNQEPEADR